MAFFNPEEPRDLSFRFIQGKKLPCPRATGLSVASELQQRLADDRLILPQVHLLVVEGQEHYTSGTRANAKDIVHLAFSAGAVAAVLYEHCDRAVIPLPREWAAQTPKHIRHRRLCKRLNLPHEARGQKTILTGAAHQHIAPNQWEHLLDALGLAVWGAEKKSKP